MATFNFDINPTSFGSWVRTEEVGRLATQQEIVVLAKELAQGLKDEFASGGHNKTGTTMDSLKVQLGPMSAEVTMAGGAFYVEHGFPAHYIEASQAQALHWEADDKFSEGFARPGVWVSGYEGDPFVERALDNIDYGSALQKIAEKMFVSIVAQSGGKIIFTNTQDTTGDATAISSTDQVAADIEGSASSTIVNEEQTSFS